MEIIRAAPLVTFFIIYIVTGDDDYLTAGLLIYLSIMILLALVALVPTGGRERGRLERIAR